MKIKNLIASLIIVVAAFATPVRASVTEPNATEAVFYAHGANSAQQEETRYSYRLMASINRQLAIAFLLQGNHVIGYFYFLGRADALDQLADLAGEP